jgi:hypothetical protein
MTYSDRLNVWHLELAIAQQASAKLFSELADFDDDLASIGHVLGLRLLALVESCPFPPAVLDDDFVVLDIDEDYADLDASVLAHELAWQGVRHD